MRGFTMMEMLLVLIMLVLSASIAWVVVTPAYQRHQFESAAETVRVKLAGVRIHAVDTGVTYQFRYEPGGRRYLIVPHEIDSDAEPGAGAASTPLSSRYPMELVELPKGYRFATDHELQSSGSEVAPQTFLPIRDEILKSFPDANDLSTANGWPAILFLTDGSATPATVTIRNDEKRSVTLTVRDLTGGITVGEFRQEQR
jgi:prepilin-type N-terminal cleavage/methylation domain-containing protein